MPVKLQRSSKIAYCSNEKFNNLTDAGLDTVYVADDSEWDTSKKPTDDIDYRNQDDIISHQYVLKYSYFPAMKVIIFRRMNDKFFSFWDLITVIRFYLSKVGYNEKYTDHDYQRIANQLGMKKRNIKQKLQSSIRVPPITWIGFFSGVDITAYYDWQKYLSIQGKAGKDPNLIALNKQEFFSNFYSIMVTDPNSRRIKYPVTIKFTDTMALGPQGGLAALGNIVGHQKLNTKLWDLQDDLITYHQYEDPFDGGYYKGHMRYLLDQRPDDYQEYALGDSVVTLMYLDFFMKNVIAVYDEGLINQIHIPATLTSLADEISSHFSKFPYDKLTVNNIYNDIFQNVDIKSFLRPSFYNLKPPKDPEQWAKVIKLAVSDKDEYEFQKIFIYLLKPYLAKGSLTYQFSKNGNLYQKLTDSATKSNPNGHPEKLKKRINFEKLYADNPHFNVYDFAKQRIKVSKPKLKISSQLRNHYSDHAHQLIATHANVPPTIDEFLIELFNNSVYFKFPITNRMNKIQIVKWNPKVFLTYQLDFDKMRKGYDFITQSSFDKKHKKGSHDQFTVHPDPVYNDGFFMAKQAYVGGMNLAFNPGIISDAYKYKYDIDLKSSYVNAGLLIPDFRLDCKPILDAHDFDASILKDYRNHPELFPNGPFTIGVTNVSYHFPDNVKRVPVGYKPLIKGQGPVYVRQANQVNMTLTDVINIIGHSGNVRIHRIIIPEQKKLNGRVDNLAPIGRMQYWSLMRRNSAKRLRNKFDSGSAEYRKYDSLQLFYKLLGNGGYGKSGQGLGSRSTRDFLTNVTMYVPFSRNTNPFTAAQYTSIARYQVNSLMDLVENIYPNSLIPSVTTDGFIFCTNNLFDEAKVKSKCKKAFNSHWTQVNQAHFNGQYFELKSHNQNQKFTTEPLINIRTRFNMTLDNHIKALVGLKPDEWTTKRIARMIKNDVVTFDVDDFRMQSLIDMKHSIDHKRYTSMETWYQPKWLNLCPDDTYKPISFVQQGKFGYYLTRPFASIDELMIYKSELKKYRSLFPAFRAKYAQAFIELDQDIRSYQHGRNNEHHVAWVQSDVPLLGKNYQALLKDYRSHYVPQVTLRFLARHQDQYDLKSIYNNLFKDHYKRFSSFNQAIRRNKKSFINPLCLYRENIIDMLDKYRKR